jgi:2-hydroxychromene-2-carboxylate isomerase
MGADERTRADVEFWFEFASTYSYLSVMRIDNLARAVHKKSC